MDKAFGKCEPLLMDLASARIAKGWSQQELAARLGLKSKSYICEIEGSQGSPKKPSLRVAIAIHRELGVKLAPIAELSEREIAVLRKTVS